MLKNDVSNIGKAIEKTIEQIADIVDTKFPDNNQQLITAADTRAALKSVSDKTKNPYYEQLVDKIEMRIVEGFDIEPDGRDPYDIYQNSDGIVKTDNPEDKLFIAKLPWNALVYFLNEWDNNEYMDVCIIEDSNSPGGMWVPTEDFEGIVPLVLFDENGYPFQYRVEDGKQTEIDMQAFVTSIYDENHFMYYGQNFTNSAHIYIISHFGHGNDQPAYLPHFVVNEEDIIPEMTPVADFIETIYVDKKDYSSFVTNNINTAIYNTNISNVIPLISTKNYLKTVYMKNNNGNFVNDGDSEIKFITINPGDYVVMNFDDSNIDSMPYCGVLNGTNIVNGEGIDANTTILNKSGFDCAKDWNNYEEGPNLANTFGYGRYSQIAFFNNTSITLIMYWTTKIDGVTFNNPIDIELNETYVYDNGHITSTSLLGSYRYSPLKNWIDEINYNRQQINALQDAIDNM